MKTFRHTAFACIVKYFWSDLVSSFFFSLVCILSPTYVEMQNGCCINAAVQPGYRALTFSGSLTFSQPDAQAERHRQQHTQAGDSYAAVRQRTPVNTQLIINNISGGLWRSVHLKTRQTKEIEKKSLYVGPLHWRIMAILLSNSLSGSPWIVPVNATLGKSSTAPTNLQMTI